MTSIPQQKCHQDKGAYLRVRSALAARSAKEKNEDILLLELANAIKRLNAQAASTAKKKYIVEKKIYIKYCKSAIQ